jgi:hypothetical protein
MGREEIYVQVDLEDQAADDTDLEEEQEGEEEGGALLPPVSFSVAIVKDDDVIRFKCETDGEQQPQQQGVPAGGSNSSRGHGR